MSVFRRRAVTTADAHQIEAAESGQGRGTVAVIEDGTFLEATGAGRFTLVDFSAVWCGPCRRFAPVFRDVAADYADVIDFAACDVDASPETAALLQIRSVPTLVLFDPRGNEVGRIIGPPPRAALQQLVEQIVAKFDLRRRA